MIKWDIVFYKNSRGDELVRDFIENQDKFTYAKAMRMLGLLKEHGPNLGMPYSKYMKNDLYELRVRGQNEVRIFYIFQIENTVVLLHAFKKKTQKTPVKELKTAMQRKNELT